MITPLPTSSPANVSRQGEANVCTTFDGPHRYDQEYLTCVEALHGDEAGRRRAWKAMEAGSAWYHGAPVAFDFLPRCYDASEEERFAAIAHTTYGILRKVMERYRTDPVYAAQFRFDPRVRELLALPDPLPEPLPMARFDMLYHDSDGSFVFCEFNTDSSSGMNETKEALYALEQAPSWQRFTQAYSVTNDVERQFEGWVRHFTALMKAALAARGVELSPTAPLPKRPHLGIVVCLDSPQPEIGELEAFVPLFNKAGFACSVFDVRELTFDGETLWGNQALAGPSNVALDCLWRFCIVVDLLEHWDEVQNFIAAIAAEKVLMAGSFATQIVHDKQLFALLRQPATLEFLTPEEQAFITAHIPFTAFLDDPSLDLEAVRSHPEQWVLKPTDCYASKNVTAGKECSLPAWNQLIDQCLTNPGPSPYLVQEFVAPEVTPAIPLYGNPEDFTASPQPFGNLLGLFSHCGDFGGTYLRQGPEQVIGSARAGLVTPVLWVEPKA